MKLGTSMPVGQAFAHGAS